MMFPASCAARVEFIAVLCVKQCSQYQSPSRQAEAPFHVARARRALSCRALSCRARVSPGVLPVSRARCSVARGRQGT
eukprot:12730699-Alexandrium_andersonii.AAC.1